MSQAERGKAKAKPTFTSHIRLVMSLSQAWALSSCYEPKLSCAKLDSAQVIDTPT